MKIIYVAGGHAKCGQRRTINRWEKVRSAKAPRVRETPFQNWTSLIEYIPR